MEDKSVKWTFWARLLALDFKGVAAHWYARAGSPLTKSQREELKQVAASQGVTNIVFVVDAPWTFGGEYFKEKDAIVLNARFQFEDAKRVLGHELIERQLKQTDRRVSEFWAMVQEPGSRLLTYTFFFVGGVIGVATGVTLMALGAGSAPAMSVGAAAIILTSVTTAAQASRKAPLLSQEPSREIRDLMHSPEAPKNRWDDRDSIKAFDAAREFLTAA